MEQKRINKDALIKIVKEELTLNTLLNNLK